MLGSLHTLCETETHFSGLRHQPSHSGTQKYTILWVIPETLDAHQKCDPEVEHCMEISIELLPCNLSPHQVTGDNYSHFCGHYGYPC